MLFLRLCTSMFPRSWQSTVFPILLYLVSHVIELLHIDVRTIIQAISWIIVPATVYRSNDLWQDMGERSTQFKRRRDNHYRKIYRWEDVMVLRCLWRTSQSYGTNTSDMPNKIRSIWKRSICYTLFRLHLDTQITDNHLRGIHTPIEVNGPNNSFHRGTHRLRRSLQRSLRAHCLRDIPRKPHTVSDGIERDVGSDLISKIIERNCLQASGQYLFYYVVSGST